MVEREVWRVALQDGLKLGGGWQRGENGKNYTTALWETINCTHPQNV